MSEDAGDARRPSGGVMTRNQAVFIGVGAMVGAGIFALLGEAGAIAKSAVWLSFLIAGCIAALQGYSFAFLGKKYASESGLMGYLAAGFGQEEPGHVGAVVDGLVVDDHRRGHGRDLVRQLRRGGDHGRGRCPTRSRR